MFIHSKKNTALVEPQLRQEKQSNFKETINSFEKVDTENKTESILKESYMENSEVKPINQDILIQPKKQFNKKKKDKSKELIIEDQDKEKD